MLCFLFCIVSHSVDGQNADTFFAVSYRLVDSGPDLYLRHQSGTVVVPHFQIAFKTNRPSDMGPFVARSRFRADNTRPKQLIFLFRNP